MNPQFSYRCLIADTAHRVRHHYPLGNEREVSEITFFKPGDRSLPERLWRHLWGWRCSGTSKALLWVQQRSTRIHQSCRRRPHSSFVSLGRRILCWRNHWGETRRSWKGFLSSLEGRRASWSVSWIVVLSCCGHHREGQSICRESCLECPSRTFPFCHTTLLYRWGIVAVQLEATRRTPPRKACWYRRWKQQFSY